MWLKSSLLLCMIAFALVKGDVINRSVQIGDEYHTYPSNELVVEEKIHQHKRRDTASRNDPNQIQSVYDYLESGETRMKNDTRYEDVVLVLGNRGSGKSTIVQLLAGNNSNLISEEKCYVIRNQNRYCGDFKITDSNNKIGSNAIYSHTEVPERVFDSNTNTVFYDCPGFSDNTDEKHDIGGTYFIKKVADNAKAVKFVFAIEYFAAIGMNKDNFMQLANHATNLIQNITKFKDSIAIVATKVKDHQKTDKEIIFTIVEYLDQVYRILKNKKALYTTDKKIMEFVDILLTVDDNNNFSRIGLFREVTESGPLSNITEVQKNKQFINNILHENIKYIKHDNAHDFGYTISDSLKNLCEWFN